MGVIAISRNSARSEMKKVRRTFGRDFKLKAVRYANSNTDQSMTSIANELEIDRQALWAWIKEVEVRGEEYAFPGRGRREPRLPQTHGMPGVADSLEGLNPLRAENAMLRMKLERTIAERDAYQRVLERAVENPAVDLTTMENES